MPTETAVLELVSKAENGISPREVEEECRRSSDPTGRQTREAIQALLTTGRVKIDDDYKLVARSK